MLLSFFLSSITYTFLQIPGRIFLYRSSITISGAKLYRSSPFFLNITCKETISDSTECNWYLWHGSPMLSKYSLLLGSLPICIYLGSLLGLFPSVMRMFQHCIFIQGPKITYNYYGVLRWFSLIELFAPTL